MIPDRYSALVDALTEIAAEDPGPAGALAGALAPFVVDVVTTDHADVAADAPVPGLRTDRALEAVIALSARVDTLELALTETNRRIPGPAPADEETTVTLFGTPVVLGDGVSIDTVRKAVAALPPGLSKADVVDRMTRDGLVRRVGP